MGALSQFISSVKARSGSGGVQDLAKKAAAQKALELVKTGMTLGLGTGSTVEFFLQGLGERVKEGLEVTGIPTSKQTERRARELGIPLAPTGYSLLATDLCVDGADRVDEKGCLIKGGGGALLREKLVASHSTSVCILVDPSKLVSVFDETFPVPVEVVQFGHASTQERLRSFGCEVAPRFDARGQTYLTDNNNLIFDCTFTTIPDAVAMELRMATVPGVVEVGIFSGLLDHLVVGAADGNAYVWNAQPMAV